MNLSKNTSLDYPIKKPVENTQSAFFIRNIKTEILRQKYLDHI